MRANLAKREPGLLAFWEEKGIYRKLMEQREGADEFVLHDGPPMRTGISISVPPLTRYSRTLYRNTSG